MSGWIAIVVGWVILTALGISLIISPKVKVIFKIIVIPLIIWFSVALYYSSASLMGHPINGDPPYGSIIVGIHIVEESFMSDEPAIYLTVVDRNEAEVGKFIDKLDPTKVFFYFKKGEPVLYKIDFDKELVKKLKKGLKKKMEAGGVMIWNKPGGRKGKSNNFSVDRDGIKILNPFDILKKEGEEN